LFFNRLNKILDQVRDALDIVLGEDR
jgi:hypothetical protein